MVGEVTVSSSCENISGIKIKKSYNKLSITTEALLVPKDYCFKAFN